VKIAICDDDPLELKKIEKTVQEFILSNQADSEITLNTFVCGSDLLDFVNRNSNFDVLILDIIMLGINGIELATEIRTTSKDCKIIFLTSSPEFAVNSYKVNAFGYLLKPFQNSEIKALLDEALVSMQDNQSKSVVIKEKTGLVRIWLHTIEYIESVKHTLHFHLRGGAIEVCYARMDEFQDIILSGSRFIQCHQSFIVNMNCISKVTEKFFVLSDKTLIPISRTVYPKVKQAYISYFFDKRITSR
jgi:DNA-binding LytR/AlgR family response regulator